MVRPTGSKDRIRRKFANSFARQYLEHKGIRMFNGTKQILTPVGKLYNIRPPKTRFFIGDQFVEHGEMKNITSFEELRDMGFVIISVKIASKERWTTGQKVKYEIRRINETGEHLNKIPKDHYVEYDPFNLALRLYGPRAGRNSVGNWFTVKKAKNTREGAGRKKTIKGLCEDPDRLMDKQMYKWMGIEEAPKPTRIREVAFMITDSNEIVCFPNGGDMPVILITGMRGSGKCLHEDTEILSADGRLVKIKYKPEEVMVLNKELKLEKAPVRKYMKRKVKKLLEIETVHGRKLKLTPEHPLLAVLGWKPIKNFKVNDFIAVPRRYNLGIKKRTSKNKTALLAYLIAKGHFDHPDYIYVSTGMRDYKVMEHLKEVITDFDEELYLGSKQDRKIIRYKPFLHKKKRKHMLKFDPLKRYLKKLGLLGLKEKDKFIPNTIMELNNEHIALFISTYFSVKGNVIHGHLYMHSQSETVIRQLIHLLLRLDIKATVSLIPSTVSLIPSKIYKLYIRKHRDIVKFQKYVTPHMQDYLLTKITKRKLISETKTKNIGMRADYIPKEIWELATPKDWILAYKELGYYYKRKEVNNLNFPITRESLKKIAKGTKNPIFNSFANSDILWDKIKSIKELKGDFTVWDMEINHPEHNFVAGDIIVHNSYCTHSLVDRFFWNRVCKYKIAILNDSSGELGTWCFPNKEKKQIDILKRLGEYPLPLPVVFLHPLIKGNYERLYMGDTGFDVTISWKEILKKPKDYLNLADSHRYFIRTIEALEECKTEKEVKQVFDEMVIGYNIPPQSANKIRAEFETILDSQMSDISTKGQKPWYTTKNPEKEYNPLTASLHAGLLPVLETRHVSSYRELLSIYFNYYVGDVFDRQKEDMDFVAEKSETLIVVDEAHNISNKGEKSSADALLRRCIKEGRPRRLGAIITTQMFNKLPEEISGNAAYLICFTNPSEASKIANTYNLGKDKASIIKELGKHQCLAFAHGEHFIVYDTYGNRRESKLKEVFVGKALPCYSQHKRPKASGGIRKNGKK